MSSRTWPVLYQEVESVSFPLNLGGLFVSTNSIGQKQSYMTSKARWQRVIEHPSGALSLSAWSPLIVSQGSSGHVEWPMVRDTEAPNAQSWLSFPADSESSWRQILQAAMSHPSAVVCIWVLNNGETPIFLRVILGITLSAWTVRVETLQNKKGFLHS